MSSFSLNGKIKDEMAGVVQVACQSGRTDIIQAVIAELGRSGVPAAEIPSLLSIPRDEDGATPLHVAALAGHTDVCRALLRAGADVRQAGTQAPVQRRTPFEVASTKECQQAFIMEAFGQVAAGNAKRVRELVEGGLPVDCSNGSVPHDSLLHWAACFGHENVVETLVTLGAKPNALNDEGVTPLHEASKNGQVRAALRLLIHQADPTIEATSGPCAGKTAQDVASNQDLAELFKNVHHKDGSASSESLPSASPDSAPLDGALDASSPHDLPPASAFSTTAEPPRALASVHDVTCHLPLLWPPPKTCLLHADSHSTAHAWVTRTIVLVPPDGDSQESEGPALEVLRTTFEAQGCRVLDASWNDANVGPPHSGDAAGPQRPTNPVEPRPLLVTTTIKRALFASAQSYHLLITPSRIELSAADAAGLLYGAYTLSDVVQWYAEGPTTRRPGSLGNASALANNNGRRAASPSPHPTPPPPPRLSPRSPPTATDRLLSLPTLSIRDWPDYPSRALLLPCRHSPRLTLTTIKALARCKINTLNLTLPILPISPASRALAAARFLAIDRWCHRFHIDLIPTFPIDHARLDAFLLAPPSGPWLRGFSSRQLALTLRPEDSPQEGLHNARRAIEALEEALAPSGMIPGGWVVHVWGLPPPLAMDLAVSWLSRSTRGLSVVAHAGVVGEGGPSWSAGVGRALGRPTWVSGGMTATYGPLLQLRRTLVSMVQLAQACHSHSASRSSPLPDHVAGFLSVAVPFDNALCPLLLSQLTAFVGAGAAWGAEATAGVLGGEGEEEGAVSPSKNAIPEPGPGSLAHIFAAWLSRGSSFRHSSPPSPSPLTTYLHLLLSPSTPARPLSAGTEKAEEALWSLALVHDLSLPSFHTERATWRESLLTVHRHLHSLTRALRTLSPSPSEAPLDSPFAYTYPKPASDSHNRPSLHRGPHGGLSAMDGPTGGLPFAAAFAAQEARLLTTFLRHACRCLLHVMDKVDESVTGDVRFSLLNLYATRGDCSQLPHELSALRLSDWAVGGGPLLASPELLPATQRCDLANGLLDLYQQSLPLSAGVGGGRGEESEEGWGGLREGSDTWSGKAKDEGSVQEPLAITRRTITHLLRGLNFDTLESIPGQKPSNGRTKNDMLVV